MIRSISAPRLALLLALLALAGCGGRKSLVPVQGKVLYRGSQPAVGALVVFHPTDGPVSPDAPKPSAAVKEDGSFRPTTYAAEDGLPEGEYSVTIIWPEKGKGASLGDREERALPKDRLKGRYGDPKNPQLKVRVVKGQENDFRLDVE
jgi:hypothetical protein